MAARARPRSAEAPEPPDAAWIVDAYRTYGRYLWALLGRLGVPMDSLEDVLQEVFLVAHRRRHEFRGDSKVHTWLHGIAVFTARRHRDKVRRREFLLERNPPAPPPATPEDVAARGETLRRLDAALAELPDPQREVFVLSDIAELPAAEIGDVLGIGINTVYSRLRLARKRLRRALDLSSKGSHDGTA